MASRPALSDARLGAAVGASKLLLTALRKSGKGGGTAAPGLIALQIDPKMVNKLAGRLAGGNIVVAGTNGKTTTSRLIADIVEASGLRVIHNRSGSNLARGVAATFAEHATLTGKLDGQAAVIESDEAALPEIICLIQPSIILLNNLFRDQLDRYGELETVGSRWRAGLEKLDESTTLVVNVDDPALSEITSGLRARRVTFGLSTPENQLAELPHAVDAAVCRRCGSDLEYRHLYLSHLGEWRCLSCGHERPALDVTGRSLALGGAKSIRLTIESGGGSIEDLTVQIPGIYNAYNVTGAIAASLALGIDRDIIRRAVERFQSPFGRAETVRLNGREFTIALVKNPVGFNEVLRMLTAGGSGLELPTLIAINDEIADGRDVSWLWDVDFEVLASGSAAIATTGIRGADMANRLKYADVPQARIVPLNADLAAGLDEFLSRTNREPHVYILPTYTAMLGIRQALTEAGAVESFWRQ